MTIGTTNIANDFLESQSSITKSRQVFIHNDDILFRILSSSNGLLYITDRNNHIHAQAIIHHGYHHVSIFIVITTRAAANRKKFQKFFNFINCRFLCVNFGYVFSTCMFYFIIIFNIGYFHVF